MSSGGRGSSDWMEKSVSRWKLQPPYSLHTEETWRKYYQEREALEWRSEHIWQENGKDCPAGKSGDWYDPVKMSKWSLDWKQPRMKPCCAEILGEILGYGDKFLGSYVRRESLEIQGGPHLG